LCSYRDNETCVQIPFNQAIVGDFIVCLYSLKIDLTQKEFYKLLKVSSDLDCNTSIETYLNKIELSACSELDIDLAQELDAIDNIYAKIGFLYLNDIEIKSIKLTKKRFILKIYPSAIQMYDDLEKAKFIFRHIFYNNEIIGDIIPLN